ncbi:MAG: YfiR family protein [Cyclobacteriaceae bacterium]|nr:YfiR family protein [Cyclobacteriaceae bacterium]
MKKNLFVLALIASIFINKTIAQNYQVHSLYMYSFTKYVKWPESYSKGDFVIGIIGNSEIKQHLQKMASIKKVENRLIRVVEYSSVDKIEKCNMLFVSDAESGNFESIKNKVKGTSTLILTEKEGLGKKGSAINFIQRQNKLLFELNQSEIERAGLQISKELVKFAILI